MHTVTQSHTHTTQSRTPTNTAHPLTRTDWPLLIVPCCHGVASLHVHTPAVVTETLHWREEAVTITIRDEYGCVASGTQQTPQGGASGSDWIAEGALARTLTASGATELSRTLTVRVGLTRCFLAAHQSVGDGWTLPGDVSDELCVGGEIEAPLLVRVVTTVSVVVTDVTTRDTLLGATQEPVLTVRWGGSGCGQWVGLYRRFYYIILTNYFH